MCGHGHTSADGDEFSGEWVGFVWLAALPMRSVFVWDGWSKKTEETWRRSLKFKYYSVCSLFEYIVLKIILIENDQT